MEGRWREVSKLMGEIFDVITQISSYMPLNLSTRLRRPAMHPEKLATGFRAGSRGHSSCLVSNIS